MDDLRSVKSLAGLAHKLDLIREMVNKVTPSAYAHSNNMGRVLDTIADQLDDLNKQAIDLLTQVENEIVSAQKDAR